MLLARTAAGPIYAFDRPRRLLVVDDDPILLEFALAQLSQPGCTLVTAADGELAWERLESEAEPFDLILSDLEMPRLDGFGLLERIRSSSRHRHLPVVVNTSRDDILAIDRSFELGYTELLRDGVEDERALRDHAERVLDAARDLNDTLGRVFYFAQLAAGTAAMDREVLPLADLAKEGCRAARPSAATAGVMLTLDEGDAGDVHVACDVRHFARALRELLSNAIRHAPVGSTVDVEVRRRGPDEATLSVVNAGPDLDAVTLQRCLEAFAQGSDPLTRSAEGLGLGLPTVQAIAVQMGGRLAVETLPQGGVRARLVLPVARSEPDAAGQAPRAA